MASNMMGRVVTVLACLGAAAALQTAPRRQSNNARRTVQMAVENTDANCRFVGSGAIQATNAVGGFWDSTVYPKLKDIEGFEKVDEVLSKASKFASDNKAKVLDALGTVGGAVDSTGDKLVDLVKSKL